MWQGIASTNRSVLGYRYCKLDCGQWLHVEPTDTPHTVHVSALGVLLTQLGYISFAARRSCDRLRSVRCVHHTTMIRLAAGVAVMPDAAPRAALVAAALALVMLVHAPSVVLAADVDVATASELTTALDNGDTAVMTSECGPRYHGARASECGRSVSRPLSLRLTATARSDRDPPGSTRAPSLSS